MLQVLEQFLGKGQELEYEEPEAVEKARYALWRAAELRKALREGRPPAPPPEPADAAAAAAAGGYGSSGGGAGDDMFAGPAYVAGGGLDDASLQQQQQPPPGAPPVSAAGERLQDVGGGGGKPVQASQAALAPLLHMACLSFDGSRFPRGTRARGN